MSKSPVYTYVGPEKIRARVGLGQKRNRITQMEGLVQWLATYDVKSKRKLDITATYTIDLAGELWVADRHSEHVICAGGLDVLAAGEMTFRRDGKGIEVIEVSNQSTGYCPGPECWPAVSAALDRLQIDRPKEWSAAFIFRCCDSCKTINLIKGEVFECAVCGAELKRERIQ